MNQSSMQQANIERFDRLAADWDDSPMRMEIARAVTAAISHAIPIHGDMDVLDYGCGTGLVALSLADRAGQVVAADSSEGMIGVLREKISRLAISNVQPLCIDLSAEQRLDRRFDLVYTSMVLHHIPDTESILDHFHALLRPGGYLAVIDLDSEDGEFHGDMPGVAHHGFDRQALVDLAQNRGFAKLAVETAHTVTRETPQGNRDFTLFILTGSRSTSEPEPNLRSP